LVVADFGQILSTGTLATARLGGINAHASLLPKYRGAAPIVWAIYHGESETGVTIIHMTPRMDAGDMLAQRRVPISAEQTAGDLEPILADVAAELTLEAIGALETGTAAPMPQDPALASRAPKVTKEHGRIRWDRSALEIHNQVRAMKPWPIAHTQRLAIAGDQGRWLIHRTAPLPNVSPNAEPGTIVGVERDRILVATGAGVLELLELQPAGKRPMDVATLLRGYKVAVDERLGG
jgi:methionyl-tRNA formyltransferase